jgi:ribonuclease HI
MHFPASNNGAEYEALLRGLRIATTLGIHRLKDRHKSFKYVLQMHFLASNNAAEYEALLHGLRIAMTLGIHRQNASILPGAPQVRKQF